MEKNIVKTAEQVNAEIARAAFRLSLRIRQERAATKRKESAKQHPFAAFASAFAL